MTKLVRTRVRACKGDQSWSLAMPEDRPARRVVICTVSTLRPAYLHTAEHSVTADGRRQTCAACRYAGRSVETVQIMTLRACLSSDMAKDQL